MQDQEICGKQGCNRKAVKSVWGSLRYYACNRHYKEIKKLVDNE